MDKVHPIPNAHEIILKILYCRTPYTTPPLRDVVSTANDLLDIVEYFGTIRWSHGGIESLHMVKKSRQRGASYSRYRL